MDSVKIQITGQGLEFSADTDLFNASQIIAFLSRKSETLQRDPMEPRTTQMIEAVISSPRQHLDKCNAQTNSQKITALGGYLCQKNGTASFNLSDLKSAFRKAGEPLPKNFSRDLKDAVRQNLIYESENQPGDYELTDFAKEQMTEGFIEQKSSHGNQRTSQRKGQNKKTIREEIQKLEISVNHETLPGYYQVNTKGDRILWLLAFCDQNSIGEISSAEIEYLAMKLKDNITVSAVSPLTNAHFKKGFLANTNGKFRILQAGLEYLKNLNPAQ